MPKEVTGLLASRRQALGALAAGAGLLATPTILRAQSALTVNFVQQRGLLYIPIDIRCQGPAYPTPIAHTAALHG